MDINEHNAMAWLDSSAPMNENKTKDSDREEKHLMNKMLNFLDQF